MLFIFGLISHTYSIQYTTRQRMYTILLTEARLKIFNFILCKFYDFFSKNRFNQHVYNQQNFLQLFANNEFSILVCYVKIIFFFKSTKNNTVLYRYFQQNYVDLYFLLISKLLPRPKKLTPSRCYIHAVKHIFIIFFHSVRRYS